MRSAVVLVFFFQFQAVAQHQERTVLVYNIAFGGLTSGVGALINKPKNTRWTKVFLKGCWQGSVAGVLNYSSKKTLYLINKNQNGLYGWPAKILHAASYSIMENAALNEPFLQNWTFDLGPARFDFSFHGKKPFKARLLPESVYAIFMGFSYGKIDLSTSLNTGQLLFSTTHSLTIPNTPKASGVTFGRVSIYQKNDVSYHKYRIIAHELVHQFQYGEYLIFNTWLKPCEKKIKSQSLKSIFSKYVYCEIPYFFLPYYINGVYNGQHYYKNFYEFEADRFATNRYVIK